MTVRRPRTGPRQPARLDRRRAMFLAGLALPAVLVLAAVSLAVLGPAAEARAAVAPGAPDAWVEREHLFLTRGPEGLRVLQMIELVNAGPSPVDEVRLPVPADARWEQLPDPLVLAPGGVVDPTPLPPGGERQYVVAYALPWREPMVLRRPLPYRTEELWIWAEAATLTVRGVRLAQVGREEIEGVVFALYRMDGLEPHGAWQVVLERPGAAATELPVLQRAGMRSDPAEVLATHPAPRVALALLAAVALVSGVRRLTRRGRAGAGVSRDGPAGRGGAGGGQRSRAEAEQLKEEIVRLDVAFHNGELDEDVYRERRARLKSRLMELTGDGGGQR